MEVLTLTYLLLFWQLELHASDKLLLVSLCGAELDYGECDERLDADAAGTAAGSS